MGQDQGFLSGLNPKQLEAVTYEGPSLLILAGAGSGKTRVVTTRIAYLLATSQVTPPSVLAVTFTNKAAREMRERLDSLVPGAQGPMIKTFHSFCAWFLRRNGSVIGLNPHFVIYDDEDVISLLKALYPKVPTGEIKKHAYNISRAKDEGLSPEEDLNAISYDPDFPAIYKHYQKRLEEIGTVDFGGLISCTLKILREYPEIKRRIQSRFSLIMVDEYQDSNAVQHDLLTELVHSRSMICVVGDDDQSIYRFRGAQVKNILNFPQSFPGTKVIRLEQNYRSTQTILDVASHVVANNEGRMGKTLWTENPPGDPVRLVSLQDQDAEAAFIAGDMDPLDYGKTAILYRTNAQSRAFETCFIQHKIPYQVVGTLKFYSREEVKDTLAYLALVLNPKDQVAFSRVINKPARGLGRSTLSRLLEGLETYQGNYINLCTQGGLGLSPKAQKGLKAFSSLIRDAYESLENQEPLPKVIQGLYQSTGLWDYYKDQDVSKDTQKLQNLSEILNASAPFGGGLEGLSAFLESIELDSTMGEEEGLAKVTLITLHNTKGLEFERVYITGMEEGLFPREDVGGDPEALEEERRLFYVGITRAKSHLCLTTCQRRMIHGRTLSSWPSRFLGEMPQEKILFEGGSVPLEQGPAGLYPKGTRVYHDDYGVGYVSRENRVGGEYLVEVRFDTGVSKRFFPEFNPLEKISEDY